MREWEEGLWAVSVGLCVHVDFCVYLSVWVCVHVFPSGGICIESVILNLTAICDR